MLEDRYITTMKMMTVEIRFMTLGAKRNDESEN